MTTIHYFYDPGCGWCYGATELLNELYRRAADDGLQWQMHPGGMIPRRAIENSFRQHILSADQRIAQFTGAGFGEPYRQRVTSKAPLILDSMITTQAILAAESLGFGAFDMLKAIQKAHYQDGLDVAAEATLQQLAAEMGISHNEWPAAMQTAAATLDVALQQSHRLMNQLGVQGFPTLLIENDEQWQRLPHSQFYGQLPKWQQQLDHWLG
jgi:putative protein-disulfide isomerase